MQIAEMAPARSVILCMLQDTDERCLSMLFFEGVVEDMTDEEIALSQSTPGCQLLVSYPVKSDCTIWFGRRAPGLTRGLRF